MLERPSSSLGWYLVLALLLHLAALQIPAVRKALPDFSSLADRNSEPVELTPWEDGRQMVRTEELVQQEKDDRPAEFLGEFRNRTKRQMRAKLHGRFQQGSRVPSVPFPAGPEGDFSSDSSSGRLSHLMTLPQSPDKLSDDIEQGGQTVLNTDPVLYAGFFNRVADEIYDPWEAAVSDAIDHLYASGKKLSAPVYTTKLSVVFNREGGIASLRILKSSGFRELDEAPKKAFWETEPFPNPPSQMFEEDGLRRIDYEFHVEWKTTGLNIIPLI